MPIVGMFVTCSVGVVLVVVVEKLVDELSSNDEVVDGRRLDVSDGTVALPVGVTMLPVNEVEVDERSVLGMKVAVPLPEGLIPLADEVRVEFAVAVAVREGLGVIVPTLPVSVAVGMLVEFVIVDGCRPLVGSS